MLVDLPLTELDDILDTVDDLQTTTRVDLRDAIVFSYHLDVLNRYSSLSGVHPSVRVDRLGRVDFIVKITDKDVCAPHAQPGEVSFSPW